MSKQGPGEGWKLPILKAEFTKYFFYIFLCPSVIASILRIRIKSYYNSARNVYRIRSEHLLLFSVLILFQFSFIQYTTITPFT